MKKVRLGVLFILVGMLTIASSYTDTTPTYENVLTALCDTFEVECQGRYTIIDLWHAGVPDSRMQNPKVRDLYEDYRDRRYAFAPHGLNLLYISIDDFLTPIAKAWKAEEMGDTPYIWDRDKSISHALESNSPELLLLDPRGYICLRTTSLEELMTTLDRLSDEMYSDLW